MVRSWRRLGLEVNLRPQLGESVCRARMLAGCGILLRRLCLVAKRFGRIAVFRNLECKTIGLDKSCESAVGAIGGARLVGRVRLGSPGRYNCAGAVFEISQALFAQLAGAG